MLCTPVFCPSIGNLEVVSDNSKTIVRTTRFCPEGIVVLTTVKTSNTAQTHNCMVQEIFEGLWEVDVYTGEFVYVG